MNKLIISLSIFLLLSVPFYGQDNASIGTDKEKEQKSSPKEKEQKESPKENNTGISGQFDVISNIKPKISDATKIDVVAEKEQPLQMAKGNYNYYFSTIPFQVKSSKPKLKQFQIEGEKLEILNKGYFRLAGGNYSNIEADAYFNTIRNKDLLLSGGLNFKSGNNNAIAKPSGFVDLDLKLGGKKILSKNNYLIGNAGFNFNQFKKYGYVFAGKDTNNLSEDKLTQSFTGFNVSSKYFHQPTDTGKLKYNFGLQFHNFGDKFKFQENRLLLEGSIIEPYKQNNIIFDGSFEYLAYGNTKTFTRNILRIDAKYQLNLDFATAEIGFKTANESDSQSYFRFYPHIKGDIPLVENRLSAFVLISGGLQTTTFKGLAMQNQFISSFQNLANVNNKLISEIGLHGRADNHLWYSGSLGYKISSNYYVFVNNPLEFQSFGTVYNKNGNINTFNFKGEIGYLITEKLESDLIFNAYSYSFSSSSEIQKPYQLPSYDYSLNFKYKIDRQISVFTTFTGLSSRTAFNPKIISPVNPDIKLSAINDLNLGATYNFNQRFGAELQFRNVFNKKYQLWNYYPVQGFQVLFGFKIKFL